MAARSRTLLEMRTDVRRRAAIDSELDFYPDVILNRWINESWQDLRLELSNQEIEFYLTSTSGTVTIGAVSGKSFGSVPLPAEAVAVYGLDLTVNGRIWTLEPIPWQARADYQSGSNETGTPVGFHITNIGIETTTSVGTGLIILTPPPDQAYGYTVWYLPAWVDVTDDTHVFHGIAGAEQWVLWDVCVKVAARGNDAKRQEAIATRERDLAMRRIQQTAKRFTRAGPVRRRDSRAERLGRPRSDAFVR